MTVCDDFYRESRDAILAQYRLTSFYSGGHTTGWLKYMAGVWRLFHVPTGQFIGAQGVRNNQAAAVGDARIPLT